MNGWQLGWQLFVREWQRRELLIIVAAIALSVLTVSSLLSVTDSVQQRLNQKSAEFLAADRVLASSRPIPEALLQGPEHQQFARAQVVSFNSMLYVGEQFKLAAVKAVSEQYPLKGQLRIQQTLTGAEQLATMPNPGEVYIAPRLVHELGLAVGSKVELGDAHFVVAGIISNEPDADLNFFDTSPRVLMATGDLANAALIQPRSRVSYRELFSGDEQQLSQYYQWLKPKLSGNQRWFGIKDRRSPIAESLARAERYLLIAGALGMILAAVAIAVAAQQYCQRQWQSVAILKTLGASRRTIRTLYLSHLTVLLLVSISVGVLLCLLLLLGLNQVMQGLMPGLTISMSIRALLLALVTGISCGLAFSWFPLLQLFAVPALAVLREQTQSSRSWLKMAMLAVVTVTGLLALLAQQWQLTAMLLVTLFVLSTLVWLAVWGLLWWLRQGQRWPMALQLAIAGLLRRRLPVTVQVLSFALAMLLMLTMQQVSGQLLAQWRAQLPKDAPNYFITNVYQEQVAEVDEFLEQQAWPSSTMYPVVRGRLMQVNREVVAQSVSKQDGEEVNESTRQGVGRELNLTFQNQLPEYNELVEGQFNTSAMSVSVEQQLASRLKIALGDELQFLIGTNTVTVTVTSIRKVDWGTLKPNFFMILSADALAGFPATYIGAFNAPKAERAKLADLLQRFPTLNLLDIDNTIEQVRQLVSQVSLAVQGVFVVVLIAGVLVLLAQTQASMAQRRKELAILRSLGARSAMLKQWVWFEFLLVGAVAGLLGAIGAQGLLFALQHWVLDMPLRWSVEIWLLGPVLGGGFVAILGYWQLRGLLQTTTLALLRGV